MINYINKKMAEAKSPTTSDIWKSYGDEKRAQIVQSQLDNSQKYQNFTVFKANKNGEVVLETTSIIGTNERSTTLLDLENFLKDKIDVGITVWLQLLEDKSKLRKLRGIKFK